MTQQDFDNWLIKLKHAWETKNPREAAELCAADVLYFEEPFVDPLKTKEEVFNMWQEVPATQDIINFSYKILQVSDALGIAHWSANFIRLPSKEKVFLEGIYTVVLNKDNLCTEFHQWWNTKK